MIAVALSRVRGWLSRALGRPVPPALPDPLKIAAQARTAPRAAPARSAPAMAANDEARDERMAQRRRALAMRLFGANHPVENPHDLFGRRTELDELCANVLDGGMHAVVHGPRGSGKTSLVRVFGDMADERGSLVLYQTCAGNSSFGEIIRPYLEEIGPAAFDMRAEPFAELLASLETAASSRVIANLLARVQQDDVILILDEFDRLENHGTKEQLGLLAKVLADMRARVRLVFVGISRNVGDLLEVHPSVRRHLVAIGLSPIPAKEVENFITSTGRAIGHSFTPKAVAMLSWLVCGSPYHMRFYSLHASLAALDAGEDKVDEQLVLAGLRRALATWRAMNERDYDLFERLIAEHRGSLGQLESFATRSATSLEFTFDEMVQALGGSGGGSADAAQLARELTPALGQVSDDGSRLVFEDVLAPQFLLAMAAVARMETREAAALATGGQMR
jgi:hypothetical protein